MDITVQNVLLVGAVLLFLAILAGQTSYKFGIPTLILFLGVGMLAGSEGIGGIQFGYDKAGTVQFIGVVALNFILFSGGLDTKWKEIRPIVKRGAILSTLGVILTAVSVGFFVHLITDFDWAESMLLGSIVSSTDAAAVFNILNSKNLSLKNNLKPLLEFESGSNDPMAFLLTTFFVGMVGMDDFSLWKSLGLFVWQLLMGAVMGVVMGRISTLSINKIKIGYEGLYPVLVIALMLMTYSFTNAIGANGFLAVYICAIFVGNRKISHRQTIVGSFDGYAWLMQLVLFLTLGLLVFPSEVWDVKWTGLLISGFIIVVARPLAVFICSAFLKEKMGPRSMMFVSWVGLRGAAPIVFATYPLIAGVEKSSVIFSIVFLISFTSMIVQGSTISWMAKKLRLAIILPASIMGRKGLDTKTEMLEVKVLPSGYLDGKTLLEAELPEDARVSMILRRREYIVPNGHTMVKSGDVLFIICKNPDELRRILN